MPHSSWSHSNSYVHAAHFRASGLRFRNTSGAPQLAQIQSTQNMACQAQLGSPSKTKGNLHWKNVNVMKTHLASPNSKYSITILKRLSMICFLFVLILVSVRVGFTFFISPPDAVLRGGQSSVDGILPLRIEKIAEPRAVDHKDRNIELRANSRENVVGEGNTNLPGPRDVTRTPSQDEAKVQQRKYPGKIQHSDGAINSFPTTATKIKLAEQVWTCDHLELSTQDLQLNRIPTKQRDVSRLSAPVLLHSDEVVEGFVHENEYNFYQVCLKGRPQKASLLQFKVSVTAQQFISAPESTYDGTVESKGFVGDPDLYLSFHNQWPSVADSEFLSANDGEEVLELSTELDEVPNDVQRIYLSVFGRTESAYKIQLHVDVTNNVQESYSQRTRLRGT